MEIKIEDIVVDMGFNFRASLDKQTIANYKDLLDSLPPVVVFETESRGYILADGFHRFKATEQSGAETIEVELKQGSVQKALEYACIANLKHGLPMTQAERKAAIKQYIKLHVTDSNVKIAEAIGCGATSIRRYRNELEISGEIEPQEKRVGKDNVVQKTGSPGGEPKEPEPDPYEEWFVAHVLHGDAFEILSGIERKFDLAIVDPPYGITDEEWDKIDRLAFTRRWIQIVLSKLKPTGRLYVFYSREYMLELKFLIDEIKNEYPLNFGGVLVWNFRNVGSMPDDTKRYKLTWEPLFYFYGLKAGKLHFPSDTFGADKSDVVGDSQTDVWVEAIPQSNYVQDKRIHPTQKPLEIYKRIIETGSNPGDSVLDLFAGSGVAGHASLELGRDCLLIEQDLTYVESIRARLNPVWLEVLGDANNKEAKTSNVKKN